MTDTPLLAHGADSDYGRLTDVLLCEPDYFRWFPANSVAEETLRRGTSFDLQLALGGGPRCMTMPIRWS
jgi:hypothetical protein